MKQFVLNLIICIMLGTTMSLSAAERPVNIAHRGASGYLPEHTLPAKALAYGMGADFIEQDIVLTKDDMPIIVHDIHLDTVTDVASCFPDRARKDGRFYAIDFTFAEIKTLRVTERCLLETKEAVFPKRFPIWKSEFRISSLQEEIELIQGLNKSTGRNVGIYPEIKEPEWHRQEGKDISVIVLKILGDYGYKTAKDKVYLQCFDFGELRRIRHELKCELKLIQLLEEDFNLNEVAEYADGIGPSISQIITGIDENKKPVVSDLVSRAHSLHLEVHPYTFRADSLPEGLRGKALLYILFKQVGIDGIFSDFPDVSGECIKEMKN